MEASTQLHEKLQAAQTAQDVIDALIEQYSPEKVTSKARAVPLLRWMERMATKGALNKNVPAQRFVDESIKTFQMLALGEVEQAQKESHPPFGASESSSPAKRARIATFTSIITQLVANYRLDLLEHEIQEGHRTSQEVVDLLINYFSFDLSSFREFKDELQRAMAEAVRAALHDEVIPVPNELVLRSRPLIGEITINLDQNAPPLKPAPFGSIVFK
ncbi:MAG: hypothetical protein QXS54_00730 [Candidatus Methanomethylicaceae archaeon]